jgi:hypothetical protein
MVALVIPFRLPFCYAPLQPSNASLRLAFKEVFSNAADIASR